MEKTALFIHGYHSDSESTTGGYVGEVLREFGYEVIHPTFDLLDFDASIAQMKQIVKEKNVTLVASHSLGGFYGYVLPLDLPKIFVNPCLKPEIEIPKLVFEGEIFPEEIKSVWVNAREQAKKKQSDKNILYGIFAKNDELFSYADYAKTELGFGCIQMIEGGHKPPKDELQMSLRMLLKLQTQIDFK